MNTSAAPIVYQLKVALIGISPMIWRRFRVNGDSTIADLHYILQLVMGWSDYHLNRFIIHGKQYGIRHAGGISFSDDPDTVRLVALHIEVLADIHERGAEAVSERYDEIQLLMQWLSLEKFDRDAVNRRLQQYAEGVGEAFPTENREWLFAEVIG